MIFEGGQCFLIDILDIKEDSLLHAFIEGNNNLTAFCLGLGITCGSAV
jgi:hypothetical protein